MSPPTAYISWRTLLTTDGRESRIEKNHGKTFYYLHEDEAIRILSFIGGFVDAAGYVKFDGLFTSSVTGNLVAACASVYHTERVVSRAVVCITFGFGAFFAVALATKLRMKYEWSKRSVGIILYMIEFIVLLVTLVTGLVYDDVIRSDTGNWRLILVSGLMGLSMGAHNAAGKDTIANCPSTTVMTMTIVQVSSNAATTFMYRLARDEFSILYPVEKKPTEYEKKINESYLDSVPKLATASRPLFLFVIGALIGTIITSAATYWSLLIPMGLCLGLVWDIYVGRLAEQPKIVKSSDSAKDSEVTELVERNEASAKSETEIAVNQPSGPDRV